MSGGNRAKYSMVERRHMIMCRLSERLDLYLEWTPQGDSIVGLLRAADAYLKLEEMMRHEIAHLEHERAKEEKK